LRVVNSGNDKLVKVKFSPNGIYIATVNDKGTVYIWNLASNKLNKQIGGNQFKVINVSYSKDGNKIAVRGVDGRIQIWFLKSNKVFRIFK
ncbi:MAG: hypothetical protein DSY66_04785, partial [Persephonella sp.]